MIRKYTAQDLQNIFDLAMCADMAFYGEFLEKLNAFPSNAIVYDEGGDIVAVAIHNVKTPCKKGLGWLYFAQGHEDAGKAIEDACRQMAATFGAELDIIKG